MMELRIVQHNLNGQYIAVEQLREYCIQNRVDLALIQEFPSTNGIIKGLDHSPIRCIVGGRGPKPGAAIIVFNPRLEVTLLSHLSGDYFTVVTVRVGSAIVNFVSSYFKFNIPTIEFVMKLDTIMGVLKGDTVICADVNAHSELWHCQSLNNTAKAKGRKVEEMIEKHHLMVHNNNKRTHTYNRVGMGASNIDVTMTTLGLQEKITKWKVSKGITDSDHRVITFSLRHSREVRGDVGTVRFNTDKADWTGFSNCLVKEIGQLTNLGSEGVDVRAKALTDAIRNAAESSIPRKRGTGRLVPPWWNDELTSSRTSLNVFRNTKDYKRDDRQEYQRLRNKHLGLIRHSKFQMWKSFAGSANDNVWGNLYKWVKKGPRTGKVLAALKKDDNTYTTSYLETAEYLLSTLIPSDAVEAPIARSEVNEVREMSVSTQETKDAIWRIGVKKSPGMDGITSLILRKAWPIIQFPLRKLYEDCLVGSTFPDCWKTAAIVAIPKGNDRDLSLPKSYRPVSLLPTLGKALETLIIARLREEVLVNLSEDQHGFTTGKSTTSAIESVLNWVDGKKEKLVVGVFLDISGAFDNLNWNVLFEDMEDLGASVHTLAMIKDYLSDRQAVLRVGDATASCKLTRGCPQGSQLGPFLWNMSMDKALRLHRHDKSKIVAYADDLAVVAAGTNINVIRDRLSPMLDRLINWASERGLSFSAAKTNVMTLKGGLKPGYSMNFGGTSVTSCSPTRYLGIQLDYKRTYWDHILYVGRKSEDMYTRLRSAYASTWGVKQSTSKIIYHSVFLPRITYAASVWESGTKTKKAIKYLGSKQRRALLSITGAYKTVSTDALQVTAGVMPLDLEIQGTVLKGKLRKSQVTTAEYNEKTNLLYDEWQRRWEESEKGRWTAKWFGEVRTRALLPLELDHFVTQFLTGHGDFRAKLFQFKLVDDPACACGADHEDVSHVLYDCPRVHDLREELGRKIKSDGGTWPCEPSQMIYSRKRYDGLRTFAKGALIERTDR